MLMTRKYVFGFYILIYRKLDELRILGLSRVGRRRRFFGDYTNVSTAKSVGQLWKFIADLMPPYRKNLFGHTRNQTRDFAHRYIRSKHSSSHVELVQNKNV